MALEAFINGDKAKKRGRTWRFELELAPPTEESTNEFSYAELVDRELKKAEGKPKDGDALQRGPDNQLAALAQRLEKKYGAPSPKKQRVFEPDLIDRGHGYDTSDSFVDDSEMYEDYVPPQVDTKFGGFYVNTGDLEFKTMWDTEEDMDFVARKKKKPKMKKQSSHQTPQSILASQKLKKAKQHVAAQKVPRPKASKTLFKTPSSLTSMSNSSSSSFGKPLHKKSTAVKKKGDTGPPQFSTISALSVGGDSNVGTATATNLQLLKSENVGGGQSRKASEGSETTKPPPVLPENLPGEISTLIKAFEESVARDQASNPEGKISVKTRCSYDEQLTELELHCRKLPMKKRTAVLEYVSHKLGVSRATTIKRIRQVMRKREEEALAQPLQRLKDAVDASIPEQLQLYEQELKARADSLSTGEKLPVTHLDVEDENTVDEVFDESSNVAMETKDSAKTKRAPRKKYRWNEETRRLVCEVVRVKVESEEMLRGRSNSEEILMEFLDAKVKPLWPKGWMQKSVLYKTTEAVHRHFTNPQAKKVAPSAKREKEKTSEQKREFQVQVAPSPAASSSTSLLIPASKKTVPQAEPTRSGANILVAKEKVEKVQWAVRSTGTSNGSPITILTKTVTNIASAVPGASNDAVESSSIQITPRMAQLLSSVASSQALVKSSKVVSNSATKAPPLSASMSLPPKKTDKQRVTLQSNVPALLTQVQPSQMTVSKGGALLSPVIVTSGTHPPAHVTVPQSALSSQSVDTSGSKLTSPKSKITTSPIQMKAIVSQLKPKASSQVRPTASAPKPPSTELQVTSVHSKPSLVQPKLSSSFVTPVKAGLPSKGKKSSIITSAGPSLKLPKSLPATSAVTVASRPFSKLSTAATNRSQAPFSSTSVFSKLQVMKDTPAKKVSPPRPKAIGESSANQHLLSVTGVIQQNRIFPLSNSLSSSPSSSTSRSSSPVIIQQLSSQPSLPPPPPPATGPPPFVASSALTGASVYSALEGTPILLQQQPAATSAVVTTSRQQAHANPRKISVANSPEHLASIPVTTLPFSSCASTFILTSPLTQFTHHTSTSPHTHIPSSPYQTLPPHSLTISPPTVSMAGAQVLVAGISRASGKSPMEQIYLEHSYGGQAQSDSADSSPVSGDQTNVTGSTNLKLPQ